MHSTVVKKIIKNNKKILPQLNLNSTPPLPPNTHRTLYKVQCAPPPPCHLVVMRLRYLLAPYIKWSFQIMVGTLTLKLQCL